MDDWTIVALVLMCVVFIAILLVYAYLCWRSKFVGDLLADPRLLHFYGSVGHIFTISLDSIPSPLTEDKLLEAAVAATGQKVEEGMSFGMAFLDPTSNRPIEVDIEELLKSPSCGSLICGTAVNPWMLISHKEKFSDVIVHSSASVGVNATDNSLVPAPRPMIFPEQTLIMRDTPITIRAVAYAILESQGTATELTGAEVVNVIENALHKAVTDKCKISVDLSTGARVIIDGDKVQDGDGEAETARYMWFQQNRAGGEMKPLARKEGVVRYCCDDDEGSARWHMYTGPFHLRPGRVCVTAEATTTTIPAANNGNNSAPLPSVRSKGRGGSSSSRLRSEKHTISKVYTVQPLSYEV